MGLAGEVLIFSVGTPLILGKVELGDVTLLSSVLSLRGPPTAQPLACGSPGGYAERLLLWNGEVYNGLSVGAHQNDTMAVGEALATSAWPVTVLEKIQGEWAFVYFDPQANKLWFGR